jgi:hypothetical protein
MILRVLESSNVNFEDCTDLEFVKMFKTQLIFHKGRVT